MEDFEQSEWGIDEKGRATVTVYQNGKPVLDLHPRYQPGDILAVRWYKTPRSAFADLFDKLSGKGTWNRNPYVWVYEFERAK